MDSALFQMDFLCLEVNTLEYLCFDFNIFLNVWKVYI